MRDSIAKYPHSFSISNSQYSFTQGPKSQENKFATVTEYRFPTEKVSTLSERSTTLGYGTKTDGIDIRESVAPNL